MEIVICAGGLPFASDTLAHRSLGGSETAALMLAKELRIKGHLVTIFCNLPVPPHKDAMVSGAQDEIGVRWVAIEQFNQFITSTEVDLLIVSRAPQFFNCAHQAKKAVLWCHDLMTHRSMGDFMNASWNFNVVWTVSEYHKDQIHSICGYPKERIDVLDNGIVEFKGLLDVPKREKSLLYSARPERGLEYLVKEGGIMEKLPDFTLDVTFYENYPEHMMEYYNHLWNRCNELPNVNLLGPKTQRELRQLMKSCWAYAYPTNFEEVFCILAKEAIEVGLPFITTKVGALPGTLGFCAKYMNTARADIGSEQFLEDYAQTVRRLWDDPHEHGTLVTNCKKAHIKYWSDIAGEVEDMAGCAKPSDYSRIHSMIYNGDIVPAIAFSKTLEDKSDGIKHLDKQFENNYPFLFGTISIADYYKKIYEFEEEKGVPERQSLRTLSHTPRYNEIANQVNLSAANNILEYGCAEGPIILQLAQDFPDKKFYGIDFVESNIGLCKQFAKDNDITNAFFAVGSTDDWPEEFSQEFDAVIIAEVMEHVVEPWIVTDALEQHVRLGGKLILTVPQGPWEWNGLTENPTQWEWRAHIWHINKWMLREMYADKEGCSLSSLVTGQNPAGQTLGHVLMTFDVDRVAAHPIDPLEKALEARARQTMSVAMIAANEEDKILHCLNSINQYTQQIQIALGPSTDRTREYVETWADNHPWCNVTIRDVPKIEVGKFGFDDARNASVKDLDGDWILWIDCDEYLSGNCIELFLKDNAFDSYAIFQHHFTCDPRGEPTQLDKPARLYRNDGRFTFYGKVHEHAEIGPNGGPGFVMVLPNVDIGHVGYKNELVRRERFGRNYPFLEWDREVYPERKMGKYLWLRDIIHRMQHFNNNGNVIEARLLAEEAISFYEENASCFAGVGGGIGANKVLEFRSNAMALLGRGFEVKVTINIDGSEASYGGIFDTPESALDLGEKALSDQFEKRTSGYWQ
jgi:glycosyltransferase involved in cell wall biosynthesis